MRDVTPLCKKKLYKNYAELVLCARELSEIWWDCLVLTPHTPHTILHPHNTETETEDVASPLRPSMASRSPKWRLWDWRAPVRGRERFTLFSEQIIILTRSAPSSSSAPAWYEITTGTDSLLQERQYNLMLLLFIPHLYSIYNIYDIYDKIQIF